MRDDLSQKMIGVSASGFCLKERLGNLRNVIDQNSDEMRIAMIAMQDEQFAHQTFMSELCNHKHFFSNQFRTCHSIDFKAPYSTFQCQMTKRVYKKQKRRYTALQALRNASYSQTCQTVTLSNELSIYCLSIYISHTPLPVPHKNHTKTTPFVPLVQLQQSKNIICRVYTR